MTYNTRQKDIIEQFVRTKQGDFSIKELFAELLKRGEDVSQTTVYRIIDSLVESGVLKKTVSADNQIRYQYLEACDHYGHCYLKCNTCGKLEHVDCEDLCDLTEHIKRQHKFTVDEANIVINGTCGACK